jgi:hypothetical protein
MDQRAKAYHLVSSRTCPEPCPEHLFPLQASTGSRRPPGLDGDVSEIEPLLSGPPPPGLMLRWYIHSTNTSVEMRENRFPIIHGGRAALSGWGWLTWAGWFHLDDGLLQQYE